MTSALRRNSGRLRRLQRAKISTAVAALIVSGCTAVDPSPNPSGYANTSDLGNRGAAFVGSAACTQCHGEIAEAQALHSHAHALSPIAGSAPVFPAAAQGAGVPNPPDGLDWGDISYVIDGYAKRALFLDQAGYILTSGANSVDTQWNLAIPANGTQAGFVPYRTDRMVNDPFDYSDFVHFTTGAMRLSGTTGPKDNRPGILGNWSEPGVQCEACHGPGSAHYPADGANKAIDNSRIFVDPAGSRTCFACHSEPYGDKSGRIAARDGFIAPFSEGPQLKASGGHSHFQCGYCHDPHRSTVYDLDKAISNQCTLCHSGKSMAGHEGKVFQRGSYREVLSCKSCHMPFATLNGTPATQTAVGPEGRMGNFRSHIFRINTEAVNYTTFLSDDGTEVRRDENGQAAVTVDFVCLRCHGGTGVFQLVVGSAAEIAKVLHQLP